MRWESRLIQAVPVRSPQKNAALHKTISRRRTQTGGLHASRDRSCCRGRAGTRGSNGHTGLRRHGRKNDRPDNRSPARPRKKTAMKTVVYHGYEFQVPASWPVYRLDQHPTTCVRYDVHAVYLGTPGANMQCPAGLVGRTQTVSVIPSATVAAGSGSATVDQRQQPDGIGGTEVRRCPRCAARSRRTRPSTSCGSRSARRRSAPPSSRPTAPIRRSWSRCSAPCGPLRPGRAQTRSRARRRRYRSRRASARPHSSGRRGQPAGVARPPGQPARPTAPKT